MSEEFIDQIKDFTETLCGSINKQFSRLEFIRDNGAVGALIELTFRIIYANNLHDFQQRCTTFYRVYNEEASERARIWFDEEIGEKGLEKLNYLLDNFRIKNLKDD